MSTLSRVEHRVAQLEREARRLAMRPSPSRVLVDEARIVALVRRASDEELARLEAAPDEDERAVILAAVEARTLGAASAGLSDGEPRTLIADAVTWESWRRRFDVPDLATLAEWCEPDEVERLIRLLEATDDEARKQGVLGGVLERAARRVELGLPRSHVLRMRSRGRASLACMRGVEGCRCLSAAVELAEWERLGLAGVRSAARHRHAHPKRRRPTGAVRRRRGRELAAVRAPALSPVVEAEPADEGLEEVVLVVDVEDAQLDIVELGGSELAEVEQGDEVEEPEPVAPVTVSLSGGRLRSARVPGRAASSAPLTDEEAAGLAVRLGLGTPAAVVARDLGGWVGGG